MIRIFISLFVKILCNTLIKLPNLINIYFITIIMLGRKSFKFENVSYTPLECIEENNDINFQNVFE